MRGLVRRLWRALAIILIGWAGVCGAGLVLATTGFHDELGARGQIELAATGLGVIVVAVILGRRRWSGVPRGEPRQFQR